MKKNIKWMESPEVAIKIHSFLFFFWTILALVAIMIGFISSMTFISVLSIVALSLSYWAAIQAAQAEKRQKKSSPSW